MLHAFSLGASIWGYKFWFTFFTKQKQIKFGLNDRRINQFKTL